MSLRFTLYGFVRFGLPIDPHRSTGIEAQAKLKAPTGFESGNGNGHVEVEHAHWVASLDSKSKRLKSGSR